MAARRERAAHAELGDGRTIGDERAARRPRCAVAAPRTQQRSALRRRSGAMPASRHTSVRTTASASRHAPPASDPPRGATRPPFPLLSLHQSAAPGATPPASARVLATAP